MTVWIVNPVKNDDLSSAQPYGVFNYVSPRYIYADEIDNKDLPPSEFTSRLEAAADDFNPDTDYLLLAGDHLQTVILASMISARHENYRVLRFDRKVQGFVEVLIRT